MIEIRCTHENMREELSDKFPNPSEEQIDMINGVVKFTDSSPHVSHWDFSRSLGVKITIVTQAEIDADLEAERAEWAALPIAEKIKLMHATGVGADPEKTLSDLQKVLAITPEEDEEWRVVESQRAREGQEDHAARRAQIKTGGSGYYARTVDSSLPTQQNEEYKRVGKLLETAMAIPSLKRAQARQELKEMVLSGDYARAVDNANTAEVGTFTDGPEERYQAVPYVVSSREDVRIVRVFDRQRPKRALCWGTVEDMDLIVDALNAWEASQ